MSVPALQPRSRRRRTLALASTISLLVAMGVATAAPANAATPECGPACISVFSTELGPSFVEAVLEGGDAQVGQPVGLRPASGTDSSLDFVPGGATTTAQGQSATVADFFADGMVSAEANEEYGSRVAVQQIYAPYGIRTDLCVGVERVTQGEDLVLIPCSEPGRTVWIVYPTAQTSPGFAIVNAATTDFDRPFAMHLPVQETATGGQEFQMELRRLQFVAGDGVLPMRQVWGAIFGPRM
ncbi:MULTISPECIES: hypothetical protein [unclassified Agromyces]|uniref:hypothetical protein n=1 Tax=unclassified Agromyces TaxID=2639701 RepID=UPI003014E8FA